MHTSSYQQQVDRKQLPLINSSEGTYSNKRVSFFGNKNNFYEIELGNSSAVSGEMHEIAKILVEHMETVEDSREQIKRGNTITWDELKKISKSRKK